MEEKQNIPPPVNPEPQSTTTEEPTDAINQQFTPEQLEIMERYPGGSEDSDQSEPLRKRASALFLIAAILPFAGFIVGSGLNPTGWMSNLLVLPYVLMLPIISITALIPGAELTNTTLFLAVIAIVIIVHFIRRKYKASNSPNRKLNYAAGAFIVSLLYTIFITNLIATAEEHEFTG